MTEQLKCDKCGNTALTLLGSNIQGLNKVVDIYFCRKCQTGKTVITVRDNNPTQTISEDGDTDDYEEVLEEPENPYEEEYDGWDPNIG